MLVVFVYRPLWMIQKEVSFRSCRSQLWHVQVLYTVLGFSKVPKKLRSDAVSPQAICRCLEQANALVRIHTSKGTCLTEFWSFICLTVSTVYSSRIGRQPSMALIEGPSFWNRALERILQACVVHAIWNGRFGNSVKFLVMNESRELQGFESTAMALLYQWPFSIIPSINPRSME